MNTLIYLILTGVIIVVGLFLKNWQPPIKQQYIAMVLLIVGAALGYYMVENVAYGFLIAGLVFYKDKLVEEVRLVKESFTEIKKDSTQLKGEMK